MQLFKFFLLFFICVRAASTEAAFFRKLNPQQKKYWYKLGHYKKSFGGYKSIADGKEFFLHLKIKPVLYGI